MRVWRKPYTKQNEIEKHTDEHWSVAVVGVRQDIDDWTCATHVDRTSTVGPADGEEAGMFVRKGESKAMNRRPFKSLTSDVTRKHQHTERISD